MTKHHFAVNGSLMTVDFGPASVHPQWHNAAMRKPCESPPAAVAVSQTPREAHRGLRVRSTHGRRFLIHVVEAPPQGGHFLAAASVASS